MSASSPSPASPFGGLLSALSLMILFCIATVFVLRLGGSMGSVDRAYEGDFSDLVARQRLANLELVRKAQESAINQAKVGDALKSFKSTPATPSAVVVPGSAAAMASQDASASAVAPGSISVPATGANAGDSSATAAPVVAPGSADTPSEAVSTKPTPSTTPPPTAAPAVTPPQAVVKPKEYKVLPGDTLSKIGSNLGIDWKLIAEWNGLTEPYPLKGGEVLRLSPSEASSGGTSGN